MLTNKSFDAVKECGFHSSDRQLDLRPAANLCCAAHPHEKYCARNTSNNFFPTANRWNSKVLRLKESLGCFATFFLRAINARLSTLLKFSFGKDVAKTNQICQKDIVK